MNWLEIFWTSTDETLYSAHIVSSSLPWPVTILTICSGKWNVVNTIPSLTLSVTSTFKATSPLPEYSLPISPVLISLCAAAHRDINTGDIGRLYSGRGEVALKVEVTDKVKEGIVFTTFHFPEHMVNMVTGHGKDEETMCAEYKVSSVEVQKISNQFKTKVKPKEHQAEVS